MAEQLTVQKDEYGPLLKVVNALAGVLDRLGQVPLDTTTLIEIARKKCGLQDLGDPAFRRPLEVAIKNILSAELSALGRLNTHKAIIAALINRLQITDYIKRHPSITAQPIRRPLFILGFPRTGTTLLQNLLSLNPERRALQFWELISPAPVSEDPRIDRRRRLRRARISLFFAYRIAPEMKYVHEVRADTAEECWPLFFNTFSVMNYDLQAAMRDYGTWLLKQDMVGPYREYRQQLQLLSHHQPGVDYVLKCPEHLWFLDALLAVFPDACIVWTHRDPVASIASYCSLISLNQRMLYGRVSPRFIGAHITERFHIGMERAMEARTRYPPEQFYDVDFTELVADPGAMVRRIHAHFSLPQPADMDQRMSDWLNNGRADKRGRHRYSAEKYGLDAAAIHRQYASYIERFSIPVTS